MRNFVDTTPKQGHLYSGQSYQDSGNLLSIVGKCEKSSIQSPLKLFDETPPLVDG